MNKKILSIIVICLGVFFVGCTKKEPQKTLLEEVIIKDKITVGVKKDTKPFGFESTECKEGEAGDAVKIQGLDVDIARAISKALLGSEDKVELVPVTASNRIFKLASGEVDMVIATMTITPQRKQVLSFSRPYYMAGQAILVPKNSDITSMSDLDGKKVIVVYGSTAEKNIRLVAPQAIILGYKTYPEAAKALKQGEADAITSDDTILLGLAMDNDDLKLLPKRYSKEPYAVAFKKGLKAESLKVKVDYIISDMVEKGTIQRLKEKWIKY